MSVGYDYTKEVPFDTPGEEAESFTIENAAAPSLTGDQIEKANEYPSIPPGDHVLVVAGFRDKPVFKVHKVVLDGQLASFEAASIAVKFALPSNPRATVEDYFVLPPAKSSELTAYTRGIPYDEATRGPKRGVNPGLNANKFYYFMDRLGFKYEPGSTLPEAALRLGNWKGRAIQATVEDGGHYTDKEGNKKKGFNKIKFWSYRPVDVNSHGPQTIGRGNSTNATAQASPPTAGQPLAAHKDKLGFNDV